jgi:hypothetical protein
MLSTEFLWLRRLRLTMDLIPGPPHGDKTLYSSAIQVIARYPAEEVAAAVSMLPNIHVELDGTLDQRAWRWRWTEGNRAMTIGFSTLDGITSGQTATWGGCSLDMDCFVGDLLTLCQNLRKTHPDIWLHYDGRVFTPQGLLEKIRQMYEEQVLTDFW